MNRSNKNWPVVQLIMQLKAYEYEKEYPDRLLEVRRSFFVELLYNFLSYVKSFGK